MQLKDKTILIAGASSGIGRQLAVELAARGNRMIVTARRLELLNELVEEIRSTGGEAFAIQADAMVAEDAGLVVQKAVDQYGQIHVAILNVGGGPVMNMADISVDVVLENMRFNYDTFVHFLIPLMDHMKPFKQGMIVHTNSLAGYLGLPMQGPYSAAKSAARILMDTCRIELRKYNLKFVSVHPGFVRTERQLAYEQPMPASLSEAQAVGHIIRAMEKESMNHLFPFLYKVLIRMAAILPKKLVDRLLLIDLPDQY